MIRLTYLHVALISTAASILTSALHATTQAVFALNYDAFGVIAGYIVGRVLGDAPIAIICFGATYGLLKLSRIKLDSANSSTPSR